ncbi:MAG TPA: hypothetical protein VD969_22150 [Symbiobacteriaceae bacterium]|nr:hypothetical protein [Symbiobacteriaceae bacterium]
MKAAVGALKGRIGELHQKESLLAVLDQLDEIDERLNAVSDAYKRQNRAIEKLKRNQGQQPPTSAGI